MEEGQITSQALANNLIGDPATRDYVVYLPPGYHASDKHYPVVYALHFFSGDEWQMTPMGMELNELIAADGAREVILVFPDGDNSFDGSMYLSSPTIGDYETFIVRELVAHIDANYRTLPERDSRGITGCDMGGEGALRLALKYPDVFSVAAAISGRYDYENEAIWDEARAGFRSIPESLDDVWRLRGAPKWLVALVAATASNPDKPPLYLDVPFEIVDGESQIVPEVFEKVTAAQPSYYVDPYLNQPLRLQGLLILHAANDNITPVEGARAFDELLTESGVDHQYHEIEGHARSAYGGHCDVDLYPTTLQFMSDHLTFP